MKADKSRSLQRLVMPKPVRVWAWKDADAYSAWIAAEFGPGEIRAGGEVATMLVPLGEWELIKREAAMFHKLVRAYRGTVVGVPAKAEDLVRSRHNVKLSDAHKETHPNV